MPLSPADHLYLRPIIQLAFFVAGIFEEFRRGVQGAATSRGVSGALVGWLGRREPCAGSTSLSKCIAARCRQRNIA